MANANQPIGLRPYRRTSGEPYNGAYNIYYLASSYGSNLFVGDPVTYLTNSADANGIPGVTIATAGSSNYVLGCMVGVVAGGEPVIPVLQSATVYHPASTGGYILVADDPDLLYYIQEDSVGGALAQGAPNRNINLTAGAGGSTVTGLSSWMIQSSSLQTTNTLQMRVIRLLEQQDNAVGNFAKWLCRINLNAQGFQTGV